MIFFGYYSKIIMLIIYIHTHTLTFIVFSCSCPHFFHKYCVSCPYPCPYFLVNFYHIWKLHQNFFHQSSNIQYWPSSSLFLCLWTIWPAMCKGMPLDSQFPFAHPLCQGNARETIFALTSSSWRNCKKTMSRLENSN